MDWFAHCVDWQMDLWDEIEHGVEQVEEACFFYAQEQDEPLIVGENIPF